MLAQLGRAGGAGAAGCAKARRAKFNNHMIPLIRAGKEASRVYVQVAVAIREMREVEGSRLGICTFQVLHYKWPCLSGVSGLLGLSGPSGPSGLSGPSGPSGLSGQVHKP